MALSIFYNPGEYFGTHKDLIFTVLDSVKANNQDLYPNYKYVLDVYIGVVQVARLISVPKPDTKIGVFNVANIVRNYVANDFNPTPNSILAQQLGEGEFYVTTQMKFGEDYGFTTYTNILVDEERTYFNHYQLGSIIGYADRPLTTRPYATKVYRNAASHFIPFMPSDDTTINLIIRSYTSGNTLIGTTTQPFTPETGSSDVQHLFNVSPAAINAEVPGFISAAVSYYTIEFNTTNIINDSVYRFDLICESIYTPYTIHFLNQFGGFESKDFTKVNRKNIQLERSSYGKIPYIIGADGIPRYSNEGNVYNETKSVVAVQWTEKMTLNSDFITDLEYEWLAQLITSPQVYIEMDGSFYPVAITGNNYEYRKVVNDNLTNLTIDIDFGRQLNSQFR